MPESTPDPSGYSRHISYTLPEQTKTLLQVRTIDGALVEVLVEGIFPREIIPANGMLLLCLTGVLPCTEYRDSLIMQKIIHHIP